MLLLLPCYHCQKTLYTRGRIYAVTFFPYDTNGNRGIAAGLNNVMKFKDDDSLGGRASADADFAEIKDDDDDDEDL